MYIPTCTGLPSVWHKINTSTVTYHPTPHPLKNGLSFTSHQLQAWRCTHSRLCSRNVRSFRLKLHVLHEGKQNNVMYWSLNSCNRKVGLVTCTWKCLCFYIVLSFKRVPLFITFSVYCSYLPVTYRCACVLSYFAIRFRPAQLILFSLFT